MNKQRILFDAVELSRVDRTFNNPPQPIQEVVETEDGTEYVYYVDTKNLFNITFIRLSAKDANTLDSKAGRNSIRAKYDEHTSFTLTIYDEDGNVNSYTVRFTSYVEEALRPLRGDKDWRYNINLSLKET